MSEKITNRKEIKIYKECITWIQKRLKSIC